MDWLSSFLGISADGLTAGSVMGGVAVIILALRRRRDVGYDEMQKRITTLEGRVETLETEHDEARAELAECRDTQVQNDRDRFMLRSTLARHGIPDPTALEAS